MAIVTGNTENVSTNQLPLASIRARKPRQQSKAPPSGAGGSRKWSGLNPVVLSGAKHKEMCVCSGIQERRIPHALKRTFKFHYNTHALQLTCTIAHTPIARQHTWTSTHYDSRLLNHMHVNTCTAKHAHTHTHALQHKGLGSIFRTWASEH